MTQNSWQFSFHHLSYKAIICWKSILSQVSISVAESLPFALCGGLGALTMPVVALAEPKLIPPLKIRLLPLMLRRLEILPLLLRPCFERRIGPAPDRTLEGFMGVSKLDETSSSETLEASVARGSVREKRPFRKPYSALPVIWRVLPA